MFTLAQLTAEPWWTREIVTLELDWLGDELVRRTGQPAVAFGAKGNVSHLRGGHRSQEWIINSDYCTSRTYTVQSGLTAEQLRHIAACDWTPGDWGTAANRALMVTITKRVLAALRAGQLVGVTEVIGTLDGKTVHAERANGTTFSADSSHLDHLHLTFDRRQLRNRALMERLADLITGDDMSLTAAEHANLAATDERVRVALIEGKDSYIDDGLPGTTSPWIVRAVKALAADVAELKARPAVQAAPVDPAAFKAALLDPEVVDVYAKAAAVLVHADLAD